MRARRTVRAAATAVLAVVLTACTTSTVTEGEPRSYPSLAGDARWDTSWESAVAPLGLDGQTTLTDTTLRQVVHLSLGGQAVRVTLSNVYGSAPLAVGRTTIATSAGGADVAAGTLRPLTFGGSPSVTIPAGGQVTSDPLTRAVAPRADLVVSTHLVGRTGWLDTHGWGQQTLYTAGGDHTSSGGRDFAASGGERYVLTDVQVTTTTPRPTFAFFGDSITDGYLSTVDGNDRYPDQVADLYGATALPGIANSGLSGNMLLGDAGRGGERGVERFARDVVARPGVTTCVVLIGINDINVSDATAAELADGYRSIVSQAHAAGIRVVGATILPERGFSSWTPARELQRQAVNTVIRHGGVFDEVVDLDAVLRDPAQPDRLLPAFDSGDHLHPGVAGYGAIAAAVFRALQESTG